MGTSSANLRNKIGNNILQRNMYVCNQILRLYLRLTLPLKNTGVAKGSRIYLVLVVDSIHSSKTPPADDTPAINRESKMTKIKSTPINDSTQANLPCPSLMITPPVALPYGASRSHSHTTLGRGPLGDWSARRNTQHSQQTNIHAPGGIRTHSPSKRAEADSRLRPCGHWDRLFLFFLNQQP